MGSVETLNKEFTIKNKLGLHARAAAAFVQLSNRFSSEIKLIKDGYAVNGKSILGVLSLAALKGSKVEVIATGEDAVGALIEIERLIESGFGEGV
ncbi:MAG TPA: HPr family phosphocarrier protein [Thermodesulfobacteriota bacterium]|nr:HPr family phosphocarrier protein [Thermodesulfobacteriota bacterium]